MAEFYAMPQASPTMEKGTLLKWLKAEGDVLAPQDVIGEVATDKAAMEIEVRGDRGRGDLEGLAGLDLV